MKIYISPNQSTGAPMLEVLPAHELERDSEPADPESLTVEGWRYAEYYNTGQRVLVNIKDGTRRWSSGWECYVYNIEVRDVDTVGNRAGNGICADLGAPAKDMIVREDYLKCIDHSIGLMNWR